MKNKQEEWLGYLRDYYTSPKKLATVLFGGEIEYTIREKQGTYKNGKPKLKNTKKKVFIKGAGYKLDKEYYTDKGNISVDETTLKNLDTSISNIPRYILAYRENNKILSTYIDNTYKLIDDNNYVHGEIHHCSTSTGRTSSSNPNLQNQANTDFKKIYASRYGDQGSILEVDFSQLEIAALAVVSGDPQLIHDVSYGTDIHATLFRELYGKVPEEHERKWFKSLVFALIYGAGRKRIAEQGNITFQEAEDFIVAFYRRYPRVAAFHKAMCTAAQVDREPTTLHSPNTGIPLGRYTYTCPLTNRMYVFHEAELPWDPMHANFQPTELKNYPIQGFATGDIVPLAYGMLYRKLHRADPDITNKANLIITVHDSIVMDVHNSVLFETKELIRETLSNTHHDFEKYFGKKLPLDFRFKIKAGPNWYEQKEI